ncbi:helix-turn-helix domain-containing protein [Clostridium tertium]|uniref:helix-turn-helix domain-containing protein n=1 Tax=Clostridium tertium TaxID=1559 RepID=UPI0024B3C84B|nr:helix-turn-helix transcriptional regulator [Clostridium tertium]MDI9218156.1 helix-turn-helix transcriptional regulator [Clostridium tertium]
MINYNLRIISSNIKILRIKKKWKFSYVAKNTGIKEDRLRKMEAMRAVPKIEELYKISRLYDITIDDLVLKKIE